MKTSITLFLLMFISASILGQQTIITKLNENGKLTGQLITELKGKTAEQIYKKSEEWIAYTFTNTESVTQAKLESKMLRLIGVSQSALGPLMGFNFDLFYQIQIDIKEGRIRFTVTELKQVSQSSPYTKIALELMYKKGKLKKNKRFIKLKNQIDETLSSIQQSLISHIIGKEKILKDDW